MSEAQTPLLGGSGTGSQHSSTEAKEAQARQLSHDLEAADTAEEVDFKAIIERDPEVVIQYIQQHGLKELGSFRVQDATVQDLLEEHSMLTLGCDEMYGTGGDWAGMWREQLDKDDKPSEGWSATIEVTASVVAIHNAAGADDHGLINPILHRHLSGVCSLDVWGIDAVQAVLDFKWRAWAQRLLYMELASYLVWLGGFQVFTLLFQDEDISLSLRALLATRIGLATVASELVCLAGMLPFLAIEATTIKEYGLQKWFSVWNAMDIVAYGLQIAIAVMHLGRYGLKSEELSVMLAAQTLLLFIKVQYFARVLQPTKSPFVETLKAVLSDVKWFLLLLMLTVWGYSAAFYILFRRDQQYEQFSNIIHAFLTTFTMLLGGADMDMFWSSHNPFMGILLIVSFIFIMSMVLLNCLIGLMSDACSRVAEKGDLRFMASRAEIIDELETLLPAWLRNRHPEWYPAYVHVLKVNPDSASSVFTSDQGQRDAPDPTEELKTMVQAMQQQLKEMAATQAAMAKQLLGKTGVDGTDGENGAANSSKSATQQSGVHEA